MADIDLIELGKQLVEQEIQHVRFGDGRISNFDPVTKMMTFQYEDMEKKVSFPTCILNNIRFCDRKTAEAVAEAFERSADDFYVQETEEESDEIDIACPQESIAIPVENKADENLTSRDITRGKTIVEALEAYNLSQKRKSLTDESIEKAAEKERKAFVKDYPIEKIKELRLDEYLYAEEGVGYDNTFCTRFMNKLNDYGSLGNSFGSMFGVYVARRKRVMNPTLQKIFGDRINDAFEYMKESIVDLLDKAENGEFDDPEKLIAYQKESILQSHFLLKLLAVYFPKDYLPVYADERINQYCNAMGISTSNMKSSVEKALALLRFKENTPEVSMRRNSSFMWFVDYCTNSNISITAKSSVKAQVSDDDAEVKPTPSAGNGSPKSSPSMKTFSGTIPDLSEQIDDFVDYIRYRDKDAYEIIDFHDEQKFLGDSHSEGYKAKIAKIAREKLGFESWKEDDIGTGVIAKRVVEAIEVADNLVDRSFVVPIFKDQLDSSTVDYKPGCEKVLYDIYCGEDEEKAFAEATKLFGAKYALIAYLFFIKDSTRFLPVSPERFDSIFQQLNIDFKLSYQCSWDNYGEFISIIRNVQKQLVEAGISDNEISLLDAHTFVWIRQYPDYENWYKEVEESLAEAEKIEEELDGLNLEGTTRKAYVDQRVNQSKFRKFLLERYDSCCLCGVKNHDFLIASHIKPWNKSTPKEKVDADNGFLLCSNHDSLFDQGYISFEDDGSIILSPRLSKSDAELMNVSEEMGIRLTEKNRRYLSYHRDEILKKLEQDEES